jgi:nucleotide-binding universal stress UspA family protein
MTILTAVDGETTPSELVTEGQRLAEKFGEPHVVLHVMPQRVFDDYQAATGAPSSSSAAVSYGGENTDSGARYTLDDGEGHATGIARDVVRATLGGVDDVVLQGRVGEPVTEILAEADRRDAQYVVVGCRKRTPVGKAVFGSATQSILLNTDRPIVAVPSE